MLKCWLVWSFLVVSHITQTVICREMLAGRFSHYITQTVICREMLAGRFLHYSNSNMS